MSRRLVALFVLALPLLLAASALRAEIAFESAELLLTPKLADAEARGEFRFKNTGEAPLRILKVHSGCLCTVPETPAEPVPPGGEGALPVLYKRGDRQGRQETVLQVETSDGARHALRLIVDLPVRASFSPRLLFFRGGHREPLSATVSYAADPGVELLGVTLGGDEFELVEAPVLVEGALKLPVRYVGDAAAQARAVLRIRTRDSAGAEHVDLLHLRHLP